MNQPDYLRRIGYDGPLEPTLAVLTHLQQAHLLHIPFENLDIHYGHLIELDIDKIFRKIVLQQRGGFCYELNGLFCELLNSVGFATKKVSARVYTAEKGYGHEFDHLVTLVNINDTEYLTDVGFGDFAYAPIKLELNKEHQDLFKIFDVKPFADNKIQINRRDGSDWIPEYVFRNKCRNYQDFAPMCTYHQTNPESHFMQNKLISLATINGRKTLTGKKLKITKGAATSEITVKNNAEFEQYLWSEFGIKMTQAAKPT